MNELYCNIRVSQTAIRIVRRNVMEKVLFKRTIYNRSAGTVFLLVSKFYCRRLFDQRRHTLRLH